MRNRDAARLQHAAVDLLGVQARIQIGRQVLRTHQLLYPERVGVHQHSLRLQLPPVHECDARGNAVGHVNLRHGPVTQHCAESEHVQSYIVPHASVLQEYLCYRLMLTHQGVTQRAEQLRFESHDKPWFCLPPTCRSQSLRPPRALHGRAPEPLCPFLRQPPSMSRQTWAGGSAV